MGNLTTPEALALRWAEVARDPALRDLPYKIELNLYGKIEMSPANNRHARLQGYVAGEFARQLANGEVLTECPVLTGIGVRVPDVAWASSGFLAAHGETTPFPQAPEICVEIVSPHPRRFPSPESRLRQQLADQVQQIEGTVGLR
jgi:Uma2 family endonuclease